MTFSSRKDYDIALSDRSKQLLPIHICGTPVLKFWNIQIVQRVHGRPPVLGRDYDWFITDGRITLRKSEAKMLPCFTCLSSAIPNVGELGGRHISSSTGFQFNGPE